MYLPDKEYATIEEPKIRDYLLNVSHPDGGSKALYFMAHGFRLENMHLFKAALIEHAVSYEVTNFVHTRFGSKYIIEGEIDTPKNTKINIRTVWITTLLSNVPKLVTAYPIKS